MVKAQTTRAQQRIAAKTGQALVAFACKSMGTFSCDGPISHEIAHNLTRLMSLVIANNVDPKALAVFVAKQMTEGYADANVSGEARRADQER